MKNVRGEVDIYRDTPVRYLGYANEVGEAFRSIIPCRVVWFTYLVSSGYVLADAIDKGLRAHHKDIANTRKDILLSVSDTLLWQSFASVIIPGFTINRICAGVGFLQRKNMIPSNRWLPIIVGLASIPCIIHPIDNAVEYAMNITYRKWIGHYPS